MRRRSRTRQCGCVASMGRPRPPRRPGTGRRRARTLRSSPGSRGTRTAIGPNCARRRPAWPASNGVIGHTIVVGWLGLGLVLLPATLSADPTDKAPTEGQLDPAYAAGKAAIATEDWNAAIRSLSSAALRDTHN